jgi:hypothetical protein
MLFCAIGENAFEQVVILKHVAAGSKIRASHAAQRSRSPF